MTRDKVKSFAKGGNVRDKEHPARMERSRN